MKLLSTQRNLDGKQLTCDNAVFDPTLMSITNIDNTEKIVTFQYDFSECGHPLNLPFEACSVVFLLKFTQHNIHICAIVTLSDDACNDFGEFLNDIGDMEFDVRMTTAEKYSLLLSIFPALLNVINAGTKEKVQTDTICDDSYLSK